MRSAFAAFVALSLAACAAAPTPAPAVGQLLHYVRSNHDGSLAERIYVYRASPTQLEVGKMVSPCTNAAFVTAQLDLIAGHPTLLVGGRIARDGSQNPFAWLSYDAAQRTLHARVPAANIDTRASVAGAPWIVYDFDLSELSALNYGRAPAREDFSFEVALIWPAPETTDIFRTLGAAHARFAGAETHLGRRTLRFAVSGALNGELWLDARGGFVVEARFAEPNHTEYTNFRLVLQSVTADGAAAWAEARAAHWRGCPPA